MLVSPTEPLVLRQAGKVSSLPEDHGADIIIASRHGLVGVQRKAVGDLISSAADGRLAEQVLRIKELPLAVLMIEGRVQWSTDGKLMGHDHGWGKSWTIEAWRGLLWSVREEGVWVETTQNIADTITCLRQLEEWVEKDEHLSMMRTRGKVESPWGSPTNRDYARHLLMGLPSVGPKLADKLYDEFGMPWRWTVTEAEVCRVLGPKRGKKVYQVLGEFDA